MATGIIYDDRYQNHRTGNHVESPERLVAIKKLINEEKLLQDPAFTLVEPRMATVDDIKLVHDDEMIQKAKVKSAQARGGSLEVLDFGDTVVCEDSYDVALLAAGGLLEAADVVLGGKLKNAFAIVRPPGHHANVLRSSGFCIFNNMAILAEYLTKVKGLKRVAIFDIDLHHGNGTSEIFYSRNDVLFFSSHQDGRTQYPGSGFIHEIGDGEGKGYNINVPLAPGAGDDVTYLLIDHVVRPVFEQYKPEIILGSIGTDAHYSDPLSGLEFTVQGYAKIVQLFKDIAEKYCNGKMILTLEGGYKVKILAQVVVNILRILADKEITHTETHPPSNDKIIGYHRELEKHLKETLGKYWKL